MLILVSGAKMQLPLQLGVRQTHKQTDSTTTVTLCACALRVNDYILIAKHPIDSDYTAKSGL